MTCPECGVVTDIRLALPPLPKFNWRDTLPLAPWPVLWIIDIVGWFGDIGYRNSVVLAWAIGATVVLSAAVFGMLCCFPTFGQTHRWRNMMVWWIVGTTVFTAAGLLWAAMSRYADV